MPTAPGDNAAELLEWVLPFVLRLVESPEISAATLGGSGSASTGTSDDQGTVTLTAKPGTYTGSATSADGIATNKLSILTKVKTHIYTLTILPGTVPSGTPTTPR